MVHKGLTHSFPLQVPQLQERGAGHGPAGAGEGRQAAAGGEEGAGPVIGGQIAGPGGQRQQSQFSAETRCVLSISAFYLHCYRVLNESMLILHPLLLQPLPSGVLSRSVLISLLSLQGEPLTLSESEELQASLPRQDIPGAVDMERYATMLVATSPFL